MEKYGPQWEIIERMITRCDTMTDEELELMRSAYVTRGRVMEAHAWRAAEAESAVRVKQAGGSGWDLEVSLKSNGFDRDPELIRLCGWAAQDAALAISTKDLVGTAGYFSWDYDRLLYPWRMAVGDPE